MYLTLNKIIVFISYLAPNSKPKKEKRKKPSFYEANKRERERAFTQVDITYSIEEFEGLVVCKEVGNTF